MQDEIAPSDNTLTWPPPYTLRHSSRAKRVTLSISHNRGLEIVVPERSRRKPNIDSLLQEKRAWIERNIHILQSAQKSPPAERPLFLDLQAIKKVYTFTYFKTDHKHIKLKANIFIENAYALFGPVDNSTLVFQALRRWLFSIAKQYLIPWLTQLSHETGLLYSSSTVRSQSTLWGSCNSARRISLNIKLLFLPSPWVRYILMHELCHIQHLNHSKRYWELLKTFDPNYLEHRRCMKTATQWVPTWLEMNH